MAVKLNITPTLIVMGGSTAGKIGYRVKQQLIQHYGEIPIIRFFWVDTDSNIPEGAGSWFTNEERAELLDFNANQVIQNINGFEHIKEWWPSNTKITAGTITDGAKQIRLIGRLSLFRKFNESALGQPTFQSKLKQAAESIHSVSNKELTKEMSNKHYEFAVNDKITRVIFLFSTCGGTGSALSFDLAYLCRHYLEDVDPKVIAFSILPPVIDMELGEESASQTGKIRANTYAWFKEDQYLMEKHNWSVQYPGLPRVKVPSMPFDLHFLVDMSNMGNHRLDSADDIYKMIAQSIFLDTGTEIQGVNSSFLTNMTVLDRRVKGRRQAYSSIASASIVYPAERLTQYCGHRFSISMLLDGMLRTVDENLVKTKSATMMTDLQLNAESIVRRFKENSSVELLTKDAIQKSKEVEPAKTKLSKQKTDADKKLDIESKEIKNSADLNLPITEGHLESEISSFLLQFGLENAKSLITQIISDLNHVQSKITKDITSDLSATEKQFEEAFESLDKMDEEFRFAQRFIAKSKWTEEFEQRKQHALIRLEQYVEAKLTTYAIKTANDFCNNLITFLNELIIKMNSIGQKIQTVQKNLKEKAESLLEQDVESKGIFELNREVLGDKAYFQAFYETQAALLTPQTLWQDYTKNISYTRLASLNDWVENILKEDLVQFAEDQFSDFVAETSLLDAVEKYYGKDAPDKISEMIEGLLKYCVPFVRYETDVVKVNTEGKSIIGVEDKGNRLVPQTYQNNNRFYSLISTGFKHRIDVVRFVHGIPAFLVKGMDDFKFYYDEEKEDSIDPLHIFPNFRTFEEVLPDENRESHQVFALSLTFDLIVNIGNFYYLDLERGYTLNEEKIRPSVIDRLDQGRSNSEIALIDKPEVVQKLAEKLDNIIGDMGNVAAIEKIKARIQELKIYRSKLPTDDEDMRMQITREINYLQEYIVDKLGGTLD